MLTGPIAIAHGAPFSVLGWCDGVGTVPDVTQPTKEEIRAFARERGADLIGFVSTDRLNEVTPTRYKPSRLWPAARTAISMGKHLLNSATEVGVTDSVQNGRWLAWRTNDFLNTLALELGHFLENRGVTTLPLSSGNMADPIPSNGGIFGELSHRHVAAQAGLGVIGVPTICITPQYGPRCYFVTTLTVAEYESDPRLDWDPCGTDCNLCVQACPVKAITRGARTIKKGLCIPNAMPHGAKAMSDFISSQFDLKDNPARKDSLREAQFLRLHRATVFGVGTFAGCFYCIHACPVGRPNCNRPMPKQQAS